ncbi:50S ribosomal protein L11 methyltransferase [Tropicimonas marinistellae]|uniref:50S ribosomal protein L11 methyltransferase n=1 Tax=Tropicimonas marinistellae TaxID=1739787 RepID=UPI000832D2C2|nr:50S ribosomal protein L11 methyltransferase [Tropicimonas marinistellae]
MPTYTALTTLPGKQEAAALGAAMEQLDPEPTGVGVFEMEDGSGLWEVGGYFIDAPDETALALLAAAFGAKRFAVSELPEVDWVAKVKRELSPVRAGRFFVYGSHDADKVPTDAEPLLIEAAMAFGTGHHGTTLGCLRALDRLADAGEPPLPVVDVGCGTAVLAMAAARIWPGTMLASDIDPVAVDVARANADANHLADRLHCIEAAGLDHPELVAASPFGLVFANILKAPLVALAPAICAALKPGGYAILSGLLNEQSDDVVAAYAAEGMIVHATEEIGEWTTLCLRKK